MILRAIKSVTQKLGYDIVKHRPTEPPPDFDPFHRDVIAKVQRYTSTSHERIHALIESVRYTVRNQIAGDYIECGVHRGGSMMAIALTLMDEGVTDKDLFLFDTFEGMPAPSDKDVSLWGQSAEERFDDYKISDESSTWCNASLEAVKKAMELTKYPAEKIHYVKGLVEATIPDQSPKTIALLRLDTDWYESTKHELVHLYPCLTSNGVMIIDDYGNWQGARQAVDEYFEEHNLRPLIQRVDYTGRVVIKNI